MNSVFSRLAEYRFKVHGAVEDSDDLNGFVCHAVKNQVILERPAHLTMIVFLEYENAELDRGTDAGKEVGPL